MEEKYLCPHCKKELSDTDVMRGNCPFCKKLLNSSDLIKKEVRFCPNCGKEIEQRARFCPNCGRNITEGTYKNSVTFDSTSGRYSGFAIASLICGVIGFFGLWLLAIIFGAIAKNQIRESEGGLKGEGMAIAGIVLGIIDIVIFTIWIIASMAAS